VIARTDRLLLANAIMGQFLTGVATRIFIVALPTLAGALNTDIIAISWALIVYQLAGISLSVVFGRLGDMHGRHVIYGTGFAIMTVSFVLCGFAPSAFWLIVFRLIQGLGAAMIASATRVLAMEAVPEGAEGRTEQAILRQTFPPEEQGMAMALFGMAVMLGPAFGPTLGGFIIDLFDWRWIFFLMVPMGVTGVVLTVFRARGRCVPSPAARAASIDYLGAALLIALTVLLTLLLDRRSVETLGAERAGVAALVFGAILVGFIAHERRAASPVVNLALFRIRMFTFSVVSLLLIATTISVMSFLMPFYIQDVLGFSPSFMGLIFLAAPVFTIGLAAVSGRLTDRIGHSRLDRRPGDDGRVCHRPLPARRLALDHAGAHDGAARRRLGVLQHTESDGDHRIGATGVSGLRYRHGADDLRDLGPARHLLGRRAADARVPLLLGDRRCHAEPRAAPRLCRGDERLVLRVPGADGVRAFRVVPARRHQDRGGDLRYLISWREMSCVLMSSGSWSSASICKSVRPGGTTACGSPGSTPTKRLLVCSSLAHAI